MANDFIPQNSSMNYAFQKIIWQWAQQLDIAQTFLFSNMSSKILTDLLWNMKCFY